MAGLSPAPAIFLAWINDRFGRSPVIGLNGHWCVASPMAAIGQSGDVGREVGLNDGLPAAKPMETEKP
ncbi:MAG: hypothetical protein CVU19_00270 [Betaproteobacteria bacterium HGW-Betaproteobacteria-13]|jgi:hypothetical protein|nr:MAG: hypothetical protein CVU19_00270 [Betaproteobacteria bacterium HGW-Betaproteobacteria-13]